MNQQEQWVETSLRRDLVQVEAPAELWDRVQGAPVAGRPSSRWPMVWALAGAVLVVILAARTREPSIPIESAPALAEASRLEFQSGDPARVRAWANAQAGIDVALPDALPPSVRLIGASVVNRIEPAVQVAYQVGDRGATLRVEKLVAKAAQGGVLRHADLRAEPNRSGKIMWVMRGQMYTLECFGPEDARVACLLCHAT